MNNSKKHPGRRFRLLNPVDWGLDNGKTYVAVETVNGFAIRISNTGWIGLPKDHVEKNDHIFKELKGGSKKDD